jgi:hypothetical protein
MKPTNNSQPELKGEEIEENGFEKYLLEQIPKEIYVQYFPQTFSANEIIEMADKYATQRLAALQKENEELRERIEDLEKENDSWISIEDDLPKMLAKDFFKGTDYCVKYADGKESISTVGDHNVWYHLAKEQGITHWKRNK